ncbi:MAG: helix-turn-helix domain-containing protein [Oscillospiraceae bacterium]|jgi:transcriptional regulator with XRE-family HTH domain|nr:helix-turn-helix domain-containing protein [Oscillospiraceae bacterium]
MSSNLKQDISIGRNLKRLRVDAGYTQERLTAKLQSMEFEISREIISQMELGKYSIRISVLLALKHLYKMDSFDGFFRGLDYIVK